MNILTEFENRVEEVELYFHFASEIDKVETHKKIKYQLSSEIDLTIKRDLQKVIRANCYLVLYNLIESTIRNGVWSVYDTITDNKITFEELSDNLKQIWLNQQALEINELSNNNKIKERINDLIGLGLDKKSIELSKLRVSISGNLDYRSIEKLINDYSFHGKINVGDKKKLGKVLLKIKSERNALAHGNKSFRQTAEIITIQDLIEFKSLVVSYLRDVTTNITKYIEDENYRKK